MKKGKSENRERRKYEEYREKQPSNIHHHELQRNKTLEWGKNNQLINIKAVANNDIKMVGFSSALVKMMVFP